MVRTTFQGFHGPVGQLCTLPRSQVRSHHPAGLLQDRCRPSGAMWITIIRWSRLIEGRRSTMRTLKALADRNGSAPSRRSRGSRKPYREKQARAARSRMLSRNTRRIFRTRDPDSPEAQRTAGQKLLVAQVIISGPDVDPDNIVADANSSAKAKAAAKANQVFGAGSESYGRGALKLSPEDEKKRADLQVEDRRDRRSAACSAAHGRRRARWRLSSVSPDGLGRFTHSRNRTSGLRVERAASCRQLLAPSLTLCRPCSSLPTATISRPTNATTFPVQPGFLTVLTDPKNPPPAADSSAEAQ
jgi:hypothetical protein